MVLALINLWLAGRTRLALGSSGAPGLSGLCTPVPVLLSPRLGGSMVTYLLHGFWLRGYQVFFLLRKEGEKGTLLGS